MEGPRGKKWEKSVVPSAGAKPYGVPVVAGQDCILSLLGRCGVLTGELLAALALLRLSPGWVPWGEGRRSAGLWFGVGPGPGGVSVGIVAWPGQAARIVGCQVSA